MVAMKKLESSAKRRQKLCVMCMKPSTATICRPCADKVRGEALLRTKFEQKV